jgi:hypothetical protein
LAGKIGAWKEPLGLCMPTDLEFQQRALAAGARIVSTGQLTVFKFNAAWRRNSYVTKSTAEQETMLARIRSGVDFRQSELIEVVRSFVGDRYIRMEVPEDRSAGEFQRDNIAYKGCSREKVELGGLESCTRFSLDDQLAGFEWHLVERLEPWGSLRWSGPSRTSTLELPVLCDRPVAIRIHIVRHMQEDIAKDVELLVNGRRLCSTIETTDAGTTLLSAVLTWDAGAPRDQPLRITLVVAKTRRPLDLGINEDRRWLGIAVNWVELAPER